VHVQRLSIETALLRETIDRAQRIRNGTPESSIPTAFSLSQPLRAPMKPRGLSSSPIPNSPHTSTRLRTAIRYNPAA
jgi:hypothetical protein